MRRIYFAGFRGRCVGGEDGGLQAQRYRNRLHAEVAKLWNAQRNRFAGFAGGRCLR